MATVRRERPAGGIFWSELDLDTQDGHAGRFRLQLDPGAMTRPTPIATFSHCDKLRIAVGIHPRDKQVVVFLAGGDDTRERRYAYRLPREFENVNAHALETSFADGRVIEVTLNGTPLESSF